MYKSCKTEQSARRQREIEEKFIQMLAIRHFDEIKIADLCAELNIPRKAFYRYFESKESVLKASIDHILLGYEVYRSNSSPTPRRTVSSELERYFEFWLTKPRVTLLNGLKKSGLFGHLIQGSFECIGQMSGLEKFTDPHHSSWIQLQVFQFAITGLITMMLHWFNRGFKETPREMATAAKTILSSPLFPNLEVHGIINE